MHPEPIRASSASYMPATALCLGVMMEACQCYHLWVMILSGRLCRYALIVLRADDNGQGGAFALFSLLKRQAELGKKSKVRA